MLFKWRGDKQQNKGYEQYMHKQKINKHSYKAIQIQAKQENIYPVY